LVVVSSKEGRKKRVWRQFCEWLSEAVAHLPAGGFIFADLRSELKTHLALQALFT
jgi:hypothetical protein